MTLEKVKGFKLKIQNEYIPLCVKYEYLESLDNLLKTYEYSFLLLEKEVLKLEKNFNLDVLHFNEGLENVYRYLKKYGSFEDLDTNSFIYKWLLDNLGVLMFKQEVDVRALEVVNNLILIKRKDLPAFKINDNYISYLKEISNHLQNYGSLPVQTDREFTLSSGTYMGSFLAHNKPKIYMLKSFLEEALLISNYYEKRYLNFDDKLNEVYDYLINEGYLPYIGDDSVRFSNGEIMSLWFSHNRKKLFMMNDERAIYISRYLDGRKLSFERKVDELYDYYLRYGFIPLGKSLERFSDGTLMGKFIYENKEKFSFAQDNEKVQAILEYFNNRKLSFAKRVNEVYLYLIENYDLPKKSNTKVRFSDGSYMGAWIYSHTDEIRLDNSDNAIAILNYLDSVKKLDFEDKLNEVYNYLLKWDKLPNKDDLFSNGEKMRGYVSRYSGRLRLMKDERAMMIISYLDNKLSFDDKLDELYGMSLNEDFVLKGALFSDGVQVYGWLHENRERLKKLADERAIFICKKYFKLSFEEKVLEAYEYLCLNEDIPFQSNSDVLFSDGTLMGMWFSNNKRKIFGLNNILKEKILEIRPDYFKNLEVRVLKKVF